MFLYACVYLQDSQVSYVWSIQRGQHASSSKEAVLHNSKTLQQLLPVNQVTHYTQSVYGSVCIGVCCKLSWDLCALDYSTSNVKLQVSLFLDAGKSRLLNYVCASLRLKMEN